MQYSRLSAGNPDEHESQSETSDIATHGILHLSPYNVSFDWSNPPSAELFSPSDNTANGHNSPRQYMEIQEDGDNFPPDGPQPDSPLLGVRSGMIAQDGGSDTRSSSFESCRGVRLSALGNRDERAATKFTSPECTTLPPTWLPYTVRPWYMCLIIVLTTALTATVVALLIKSHRNDGLATDNNSSSLLFGWRFTPTLFAVLYARIIAMLYEDVRRTEPFAILARPQGGKADPTLLQGSDAWWTVLRKSLINRDGNRSWALFCACLVHVLAFLIIAPLSASVLTSRNLVISRDTEFSSLVPRKDAPIEIQTRGDTIFRTISNLLQNATTSAFITGTYVVFPIWPSTMATAPLGSRLSDTPQTWSAQSLIYQLQYACVVADISGTPKKVTSDETDKLLKIVVSSNLQSSSNCSYVVEVRQQGDLQRNLILNGGGIWTNGKLHGQNRSARKSSCDEDTDIILLLSRWEWDRNEMVYRSDLNMTSKAHICTTRVYEAESQITVSNMASSTRVEFNETAFEQRRTEIPPKTLNNTKLRQLLIDPKWSNYLSEPLRNAGKSLSMGGLPAFEGASAALGSFYDWNLTVAAHAEDIPERARQIQQRLFGEVIQVSTIHSNMSEIRKLDGRIIQTERRIVVVVQVAVTVVSLLIISLIISSILFRITRLSIRSLGLMQDPATVIGLATQSRHIDPCPDLEELSLASRNNFRSKLGTLRFKTDLQHTRGISDKKTSDGQLTICPASDSRWKPTALRIWYLSFVLFYVITLSVAVSTSYYYATQQKLYKTVFVYQATIEWLQSTVFAPYSILPTLLAVGLGLVWDAIDKTSRRLQPFLSMARRPTPLNSGSGLTYQSSYLVAACLKAIYNKHWLLAMISFGSVVCQVLVIAMSALFQREPGALERSIVAPRLIETRQIPYVTKDSYVNTMFYGGTQESGVGGRIMSSMFSNAQTNWMYSAAIQLTLDGFEPPWSKDGWSFLPVSLPDLPNDSNASNVQYAGSLAPEPLQSVSTTNFTLITAATKARLECSEIPQVEDPSTWLKQIQFRRLLNATAGRRPSVETAYEVTRNMFRGNYTSLLTHPGLVSCCINSSRNQTQAVSIGYWSPTGDIQDWPNCDVPWPINVTIKWLHGLATPWPADITMLRDGSEVQIDHAEYMFTEIPKLQAINCRPQIDLTTAEVTVDYATGVVQEFNILDAPRADLMAWSDPFVTRKWGYRNDRLKGDRLIDVEVSTSYGVSFFSALLGASDLSQLRGTVLSPYLKDNYQEAPRNPSDLYLGASMFENERTSPDETFRIRDNSSGLNLDLMSYAMYTLSNKDPTALLDAETMLPLGQKVFQTYFQHFVSTNVALNSTFGAYQPIGAEPNPILRNMSMAYDKSKWKPPTSYPKLNASSAVNGTITTRVEMLHMNKVATWISVVGLAWLLCTTVALLALQKRYLDPLIRDTETIAEVLASIVGSESLLKLVNEMDTRYLVKNKQICTKLGWFRARDGQVRWGIEVVGDVGLGAAEWVDKPAILKAPEKEGKTAHEEGPADEP